LVSSGCRRVSLAESEPGSEPFLEHVCIVDGGAAASLPQRFRKILQIQ
jgi:hypothetical protein